jgi:MFS family permease
MTADHLTSDVPSQALMIADDRATSDPLADVLREITRGGLAGLIVGVLLAGVGGRLVMRVAALLVPASAGAVTENGNVIGTITIGGSFALVLFIGLFFGAVAGSLWVTIRPWLPDSTPVRALFAVPIAIALGTLGLIDERNRDFAILGRDPLVVGSLVVLVASFGPALVLAERWLERRLPVVHDRSSGTFASYLTVMALGLVLTIILVVPVYLGSELLVAGIALVVVGMATVAHWGLRIRRRPSRPVALVVVADLGIGVATIVGLVVSAREVAGALAII